MPLSSSGESIFWKKLTCVDSRVSLLRVEIKNETFQGNFWESRMRMRVLGEKLRVENENESSEGENEIEIENETPNFQEWGFD